MIDNITIRIENFTGKFDNCVKSKKEKIALMKLALMKITLLMYMKFIILIILIFVIIPKNARKLNVLLQKNVLNH